MSRIEDDIKKLVFELTGCENNDHSMKFCSIFMREALIEDIPTPRSTILSTLDTFVTKFDYLGFPQYAQQLSSAIFLFLKSVDDESKESSANWSVVDLLLQLSADAFKPEVLSSLEVNLIASRAAIFPEEITEEEKINWFKYLQEGSEKYQLPDDDDDDEESDDEFAASVEKEDLVAQDSPVPVYNDLFSDFRSSEMIVLDENAELKKTLREALDAKSTLAKSVQHSWWNGEKSTVSRSIYPSANFGRAWEAVKNPELLSNNEVPSNFLFHDEHKIIRELLWLLIANDKRVLKRIETLRSQVSVSSLIQETFAATVNSILETAVKYYSLTSFCDEILGTYTLQVSFTLQAYACALKDICRSFLTKIIELENIVKQQDIIYTLLTLHCDLSEDLRMINFLFDVHTKCVLTNWAEEVPWICAVRVLSVLLVKYQEISSTTLRPILLRIFFRTFKIYAEIIDVWLTEAKMNDWKNEFFIQKSESDGKYVAFPSSGGESFGGLVVSPLFHHLASILLNCYQSIDFLSKLNKMRELKTQILKEGKLIDQFVDQIKRRTRIKDVQCLEIIEENFSSPNVFLYSETSHEYSGCISDVPYLVKAFGGQLLNSDVTNDCTLNNRQSNIQNERFDHFEFPLAGPVMEEMLCNLIRKREHVIMKLFRNAIVEDYKFFDHIRNLKDVLLLDWRGICDQLPVRLGKQTWIDHNTIKVQLYDCIENNKLMAFGDLFRFTIDDAMDMGNFEVSISKIMKAVDGVSVHYEVQWPLNMIFTEEIIRNFYAPLLKLVVKLKFASSTVTRLRFKDILPVKLYEKKRRRIEIFRHWVVLLLQKLHSYLLLAISQSLSCEAVENVLEIETFTKLSESYINYLNKTKRNCLIESEFFEHFDRALNRIWLVCDDVVSLWNEATKLQISDQRISCSVELYLQCLWFMTKILQKFLRGELCPLFDLWSDLNRMLEAHKANIPEDLSFRSGQVQL